MLSYWRNGCETRCEACAWQDDCLYSRTRDIVVVQDEEGGDENDQGESPRQHESA